jgi:prepilin-type N-terminal cleavage/methylation domain-containing protein
MLYGISAGLIRGELMRRRGYTLIEVIFSLALIGLIAATFLPMITFGVTNVFSAQKFTDVLFDYQDKVEGDIALLIDTDPDGLTSFNIFGKTIAGHNIHVDDDSSSEIYMFLPKRAISEPIPVIQSPPVMDIRRNNIKINVSPAIVDLTDSTISLFVDEISITNATKDSYLMSVYRWYVSTEMDSTQTPSDNPNQYFIVKEWNEAKKQLSYADSSNLKFIPNIKDKYNIMVFSDIKDGLGLNDEDFKNSFGNRYIRYGVTPFSVRGRIGKEELSNPVYITTNRIELLSAVFGTENTVILTFKEDISDLVDVSNIVLNASIGQPKTVYRDESNHKRLIIEFDSLDSSEDIGGNVLLRGAVQSKLYGKISIWHNNIVEGEFTIYEVPPVPVTGVTISGGDTSVLVGGSKTLTAIVSPVDATNKKINWTSSDSSKAIVNEDGLVMGIASGSVTIRAESAFDPAKYAEITVDVLTEEEQIDKDLQDALDGLSSLDVDNATGTRGTPTIKVPSGSGGITYTLTEASTTRITINLTDRQSATVSRPTSGSTPATGTIKLRATKDGRYKEATFNVSIPRYTSTAITVTK